jgi:hypothetical protein
MTCLQRKELAMPRQQTSIVAALIGLSILPSCAEIQSVDATFVSLSPEVTGEAFGIDKAFSRIWTGPVVKSAVLSSGGTVLVLSHGIANNVTSVTFKPQAGTFGAGDILTVTWHSDTRDILGNTGSAEKTVNYKFVNPQLRVEAGDLRPGETGKVCVALTPNVAVTTTVQLQTTVFPLSVGSLTVPAGASKPANFATMTADGFSCPMPSGGVGLQPPCNSANGVQATAVYGGATLTACMTTGRTCCGVGNSQCAEYHAPPPSICP